MGGLFLSEPIFKNTGLPLHFSIFASCSKRFFCSLSIANINEGLEKSCFASNGFFSHFNFADSEIWLEANIIGICLFFV